MEDELAARIREAMDSKKFRNPGRTTRMKSKFEDLHRSRSDLAEAKLSLYVDSKRDRRFSGQIGDPASNVYHINIPYSELPELVQDSDVESLVYDPR